MDESTFISTEVSELSSRSDVLPFCVYHWVNEEEGTYRSYLAPPQVTRTISGLKYVCGEPPLFDHGLHRHRWRKKFVFYAGNPMVRPIPYGMGLFCASKRQKAPYDTTSARFVYDPYNLKQDCVYFIAYTRPVPHTTPLYFHTLGGETGVSTQEQTAITFLSLSPNPPVYPKSGYVVSNKDDSGKFTVPHTRWVGDSRKRTLQLTQVPNRLMYRQQQWKRSGVFPVYVMTPKVFGPKYWNIKFVCNNGGCHPYLRPISAILKIERTGKDQAPKRLSRCVVACGLLLPDAGGKPLDLLSIVGEKIQAIKATNLSLGTKISHTSPVTMSVLLGILVVILGVTIYFAIRKT